MKKIILEANIVQPCHCNVCGSLASIEVRFGVEYDKDDRMIQSTRFCDTCAGKLAELLMETKKEN